MPSHQIAIDLHWVQVSRNRLSTGDNYELISAAWDVCTPDEIDEMVSEAQDYVDKCVASGEWSSAIIHHYPLED